MTRPRTLFRLKLIFQKMSTNNYFHGFVILYNVSANCLVQLQRETEGYQAWSVVRGVLW